MTAYRPYPTSSWNNVHDFTLSSPKPYLEDAGATSIYDLVNVQPSMATGSSSLSVLLDLTPSPQGQQQPIRVQLPSLPPSAFHPVETVGISYLSVLYALTVLFRDSSDEEGTETCVKYSTPSHCLRRTLAEMAFGHLKDANPRSTPILVYVSLSFWTSPFHYAPDILRALTYAYYSPTLHAYFFANCTDPMTFLLSVAYIGTRRSREYSANEDHDCFDWGYRRRKERVVEKGT